MRFPLNERVKIGYSFGQPTFYNTSHKGQDYRANFVMLYAPCDCEVGTFKDAGGGNWVNIVFGDYVIQCAHLSQYIRAGFVKEGTPIAITGNTGAYTTGPHLHLQVKYKGNLIDPEKFNWGGGTMTQEEKDLLKQAVDNSNVSLAYIREIWEWQKRTDVRLYNLEQRPLAEKVGLSVEDTEALSKWKIVLEALKNLFR